VEFFIFVGNVGFITMRKIIPITDKWLIERFNDDPVRPHIPHTFRVTENRKAFALVENSNEDNPLAIICTAFTNVIAREEKELTIPGNNAIFYTVWSYDKGAGREIVFAVTDWFKQNMPETKRFVTLSPPTEMARNFHLKNGAIELQHNGETVNYEYV
jgi:hypothetical protein